MRILIDECIPRKFKSELSGHECLTVPDAGLAGKKNGELLQAAENRFDVFITLDQGIEYQQNIAGRRLAVIVIVAKSNRIADVRQHTSACLKALKSIQPGQLINIPAARVR